MKNEFHRGKYLAFRSLKKLEVLTSINGKGVFSLEDIHPGEIILQFGGPIFSGAEIPYLSEPKNDYFLQIDEDLYLGPSGELDDYINHACHPNTGLVFGKESLGLKAIRFIPERSEITYDYSTTMDGFWGEMTCNCGLATCRKKIINFLDLPEMIQQRYSAWGIVPEYIQKQLPPARHATAALGAPCSADMSSRFRSETRCPLRSYSR
jgi:hypothetical protein